MQIDQGGTDGGSYSEGPVEVDSAAQLSSAIPSSSSIPTASTASSSSTLSSQPTSSLVATGASTSSSTPAATISGSRKLAEHSFSGGAIAGVVIGVVAVFCIAIAIYLLVRRRRALTYRTGASTGVSGYEKPELDGNEVLSGNNGESLEFSQPLRGSDIEEPRARDMVEANGVEKGMLVVEADSRRNYAYELAEMPRRIEPTYEIDGKPIG